MRRVAGRCLLFLVSGVGMAGCGGGSSAPGINPTAAPAIQAISPNSSDQSGPAFTLSVVGSNFVPNSTVQWKGSSLQTNYVSNLLLTAEIPAANLTTAGPDAITVKIAGVPSSNSLNFSMPCAVDSPTSASLQTQARVGAYYFDGWTGPLTNSHFAGLPLGPYQDRQPLSGWQDDSPCAVEQQLAKAHNFGIDFFVFDWYFNVAANDPGEDLNSALKITHALPDRHGMQYAILYVNGAPFDVDPGHWNSTINEWIGYMSDPAYARVNGRPVLFIINVGAMFQVWGSDSAVSNALSQLRTAAQAAGLPGVYIVGGFGVPDGTMGQASLTGGFSLARADGYDAIAFYGYPFAPPAVNGMLPFSTLVQAGQWVWQQAALSSQLPFIPTAMDGWDPRPWNETEGNTGDLMWYSRSPQEVAQFLGSSIAWTNSNRQLRPEAAPSPPLVLIEAWNEIGEGSYLLPTAGDGTAYGDAVAAMLIGTK